jgi:hypothetical protein
VRHLIVQSDFLLTRLTFQRALAFIYFIGFLIALNQFRPLLGEHGITPIGPFLAQVTFWDAPSLLWLRPTDAAMGIISWGGLGLALFALSGWSERRGHAVSVATWAVLWLLYLSLVNVGQTFYGFGWEMLLLETGFLAIFLGSANVAPPAVVRWLILWLAFRLMFGAGLIKLRGDPCWWDLTCMTYHYETQPSPNPLSWYFHQSPTWFHQAEVLFNHFVELVVPFFFFAPRVLRAWAGALTILFQGILILSGNLSWLNYLSIVLCIACFDDRLLARFFRRTPPEPAPAGPVRQVVLTVLAMLIGLLSIPPALNLVSPRQAMNASFDPLHLVNTYGAFGSITRERHEVVIEGTDAARPDETALWREYEFKAKPGDPTRAPSIVSPYHYKLDWQMWFAAMSPPEYHSWFYQLLGKLLEHDRPVLGLLARNPFPNSPPKFVRARLYTYHFAEPGDRAGRWWKRELAGEYVAPVALRK